MRVYHHPGHRAHDPRSFMVRGQSKPCPEQPARADVLLRSVQTAGHDVHEAVAGEGMAGLAPVRAVHDGGYIEFLETAWEQWSRMADYSEEIIPNVHPGRHMGGRPESIVGLAGYYQADCACPLGRGTWTGALASAEVAIATVDAVVRDGGYAYGLCRPPGHHAYADMAGGFCFLNNTAIAAQMLRDRGAAKVAVLDVDVHHGNGTQGIFYRRPDVLTVSLHGDPREFYPFYAGYREETGEGPGLGTNVNLPLPRGTQDDAYIARLGEALEAVLRFDPDVLVVALGLDASEHDPLAYLAVTTDGFRRIGHIVGSLGRPTVLVQEGGYLSEHLGANLGAVLDGFESARL